MTHPPATPQRRKVDRGRFPRARSWWERWGGLVKGLWFLAVTVVLLWVAIGLKQSQSATAKAAKVSCQRARQFGPRIADDYERRHVITAAELRDYRSSIPRVCPGDPEH